MFKYTYLFVLCFLFSRAGAAAYKYNYTAGCHKAYQQYLSLHLAEGHATILQEMKADPYNLMPVYIADYEDCMLLLMNGDRRELLQRRGHQDERISLLDRGDKTSPWHRLCKAGIYLHWAVIYIRFGEDLKAAAAFRRSYLLLKENQKSFPEFEYNDIFFGLEQAIVGAVPDNYKWIVSIFGMKGDVKKGVAKLAKFINSHPAESPLRNEAVVFYIYLKYYLLSQQKETWAYVNSSQFPVENNLLNAFVKANIAVNHRKADDALEILKAAESNKAYANYPVFDYETASALYLKVDPSSTYYFKKFIKRTGSSLFVKDAWQKISLMYYLQNDMKNAALCRERIKTSGSAQVDADKQAQRFAEHNEWPHPVLLQVRLLIDGGYYTRALDKINAIQEPQLTSISDKLEYNFRLGRVHDELGNEDEAMEYYERTIAMGKSRKEHFAARAALQVGLLNEKLQRTSKAIDAYKLCLDMKGHDFQNSIDQQAKAGINRLTGN